MYIVYYVSVCIDKYTLFTKITVALLFWTCLVKEFRNINFPEIQFTFQDGRTCIEKGKKKSCRLLWLADY